MLVFIPLRVSDIWNLNPEKEFKTTGVQYILISRWVSSLLLDWMVFDVWIIFSIWSPRIKLWKFSYFICEAKCFFRLYIVGLMIILVVFWWCMVHKRHFVGWAWDNCGWILLFWFDGLLIGLKSSTTQFWCFSG